jgi:hypothetical protein
MGYLDFVDHLLEKELGLREVAGSQRAEAVRAPGPQDIWASSTSPPAELDARKVAT